MSNYLDKRDRPGVETIIWRDGEVLRREPGRPWEQRPSIPPVVEIEPAAEAEEPKST